MFEVTNHVVLDLNHYNEMRDELAMLRSDTYVWDDELQEKEEQLLEKEARIQQMADQILFLQEQLSLEHDCDETEKENG